jgi:hypothetical protein
MDIQTTDRRRPDLRWYCRARGASSTTYLILLCGLAALVLLAILLGGGREPSEPTGTDAAPPPGTSAVRIDPDPFRQQITAIEELLYPTGPSGSVSSARVASAARRLADTVRARGGSAAIQAFDRIGAFASELETERGAGFGGLDLPAARASWEGTRDEVFRPADWFAGSEAEQQERELVVASGSGRSFRIAISQLADRIDDLISSGRDEIDLIREIDDTTPEDSAQADQIREEWQRWSRDWLERVQQVAHSLPQRPGVGSAEPAVLAHRALAKAVQNLQLVAVASAGSGIPSRSERAQRLDAAEAAVAEARARLDEID